MARPKGIKNKVTDDIKKAADKVEGSRAVKEAEKLAEEVKAGTEKAAEAVKKDAEKAVSAAEKEVKKEKAAVKRTAASAKAKAKSGAAKAKTTAGAVKAKTTAVAKKTAGKARAAVRKPKDTAVTLEIQHQGWAIAYDEIVERVKGAVDAEEIEKLDIYVKPEECRIYYVADGILGSVNI